MHIQTSANASTSTSANAIHTGKNTNAQIFTNANASAHTNTSANVLAVGPTHIGYDSVAPSTSDVSLRSPHPQVD